jgi:hypothetical protein
MKTKLSPQQAIIVEKLRSKDWVCSSEFGYIKDDRRRITDLNRGYMAEKGYKIIGEPCDGRCHKNHSSGLFMRKAVKLETDLLKEQEKWFNNLEPKTV